MDSVFSLINNVLGGATETADSTEVILPWNDYKEEADKLNVHG
jgi:hypothetical protein